MDSRDPELHSVLDELDDSISYLEDLAADLGDRRLLRLTRLLARTLKSIQKYVLHREEPAG